MKTSDRSKEVGLLILRGIAEIFLDSLYEKRHALPLFQSDIKTNVNRIARGFKRFRQWGSSLLAGRSSPKRKSNTSIDSTRDPVPRPPFNAEYLLYLFLRCHERDTVIGDLTESYLLVFERFDKRRADIWFYKQVAGSLLPLLRRSLLRIGALVWLGRILRRLIF